MKELNSIIFMNVFYVRIIKIAKFISCVMTFESLFYFSLFDHVIFHFEVDLRVGLSNSHFF